jgi:RHS repeat-associated protein
MNAPAGPTRSRTWLPALLLALLCAGAAQATTISVTLDGTIASGLGDCTTSGPGQCNGSPPDPPVEIESIGTPSWGTGLPFDMARLPGAAAGPLNLPLPGTLDIPMPASFEFMAGATGGGSGGPEPGGCSPAEGGVTTPFSVTRSLAVNGVSRSFQQTGTIFVGWCYDILSVNTATVNVNTGQGTLTVRIGGSAGVISTGQTSIGLTSPLPGTTLAAPANVVLSATASTRVGAINKVEFYRGSTLVATVTSPPYTATDTGVGAGTHTYTARAYNDQDDYYNPLESPASSITVGAGTAAGQIYYIEADHLNTPRRVSNTSQQVVWRWDAAEPFGDTPPDENPSNLGNFEFNPRFPGQYHDKETNLAYNYFRDYDPQAGRYVQSDPIGLAGGINTYTYAGSDPIRFSDQDGLFAGPPPIAGIGGGPLALAWLAGQGTGALIYWAFDGQIQAMLPDPTASTSPQNQSSPNDDSPEKRAERRAYHRDCDEPPPPNLSPCERLKWEIERAKRCIQKRKDYMNKWSDTYAGHFDQIANRQANLARLEMEFLRRCCGN